ncbi:hypothetical protein Trco_000787 [Trichoderma cornu-damae]|uniref:Hydrophobin n=1 Tax=Trichoderma cornu-damae TaxID=654480 RepID=A0A9P8QY20_9HYPO|nr:hypothetical protein Trco_000787 [Trichoderma cornu-damae]
MKAPSLAVLPLLLLGASAVKPPPVHGPPPIYSGCCCCDISVNQISCDRSIPASDCICAAVVCPSGAPTVWHGEPPLPRPTPTPTPSTPAPAPDLLKPCCCCDLRIGKTVCSLRPAQDCFCAAVVCPSKETIFVKPTAAPAA